MSDRLSIRTLGGLSIALDETPVSGFDSRKVAALLVYLAATGHDHPRDVLAEMLWEGRSQAQSLANLRVVLTGLRQTAGDFVRITRQTVGMAPDAAWELDAAIFEESLAAGRLSEALALYQGDFLAGFYVDSPIFEDWAALERERLRFRAMDVLDGLIAACLERGDHADGIAHATRLLQMDPLREESHRAMMTLLARSGQRGAALAQFETCARALRRELGIAPAPETEALHRQIKAGELPINPIPDAAADEISLDLAPIPVRRIHLPPQATRFIGRETEIAAIIGQLRDPACRLLTLLGPGGIGKTRLALAAAERILEDFPHGVGFADLASVHRPDGIPQAIAAALGFQFYPGEDPPRQQILNYLRDKILLLILDNCEHLLDGIDLAAAILAAAPSVTILATSREVLKLEWEWVFPIEGLPVNGAVESDAARLFVDRARRRQAAFDPASCAEPIQQICALVGGMPLGIELAAAWVSALPVEAIADEISHSLDLLEGDRRSGSDRHHSIRAVFDPTWARLSPAEQDVFMRLNVFRGGFTREAAQAVAGASPRTLLALLDCSLLRFEADSGRYNLHELLRQYTAEQLAVAGQAEATGEAHCHYYLKLVAGLQADLHDQRVMEALATIEADIENIHAAWLFGVEGHQFRELRAAMLPLRGFYGFRGWRRELHDLFLGTVDTLEMPEPDGDQGAILGFALCTVSAMRWLTPIPGWDETLALGKRGLAIVDRLCTLREQVTCLSNTPTGDDQRDLENRTRALDLDRQHGDAFDVCMSLIVLSNKIADRDPAEAERMLREAVTQADTLGNLIAQAHAGFFLAGLLVDHDQYHEALELCRKLVPVARQIDSRDGLADVLNPLAIAAGRLGLYDEAEQAARESAALYRGVGTVREAHALDTLGEIYYWQERYREARRIHERSLQIHHDLGFSYDTSYQHKQIAFDACLLGDYHAGREHFRHALTQLQGNEARGMHILADVIIGCALLLAAAGNLERAVELLALAGRYPNAGGCDHHDRDELRLREELRAELPPDFFQAAWQRGTALPVEGLAAGLLAELAALP